MWIDASDDFASVMVETTGVCLGLPGLHRWSLNGLKPTQTDRIVGSNPPGFPVNGTEPV